MKRKQKIYLGIFLSVSALAAYLALGLSYHNFLPQPALPQRYSSYTLVAEKPESRHYRLEELLSGTIDAPYYDSTSHNVIITAGRDIQLPDGNNDYVLTYYKLNSDGRLTDSLVIADKVLYQANGYLLHYDVYYTWILDGDTTAHKYQSLPGSSSNTSPKQLLQAYYNKAQLLHSYSHYDIMSGDTTDDQEDRVALLVDQQWYLLRGTGLADYDLYPPKYAAEQPPLPNLVPGGDDLRNNVRAWANPNLPLYISYFQKTHFRNGHGPAFMSPTGSSTPDRWEGNAYMNLLIGGDTLKMKETSLLLVENDPWYYYDNDTHAEFCYYTHPAIRFGLLRNNNYNLYIVRPK